MTDKRGGWWLRQMVWLSYSKSDVSPTSPWPASDKGARRQSHSKGCGTEGGSGCEVRGRGRGTVASPGFFLKKTRLKQTLCPKEGSHSNLPGFSWKKGLHMSTGAGHNKVPQNGRLQLQKWIFTQFCRLDIQSQATSSVGFFWELSP